MSDSVQPNVASNLLSTGGAQPSLASQLSPGPPLCPMTQSPPVALLHPHFAQKRVAARPLAGMSTRVSRLEALCLARRVPEIEVRQPQRILFATVGDPQPRARGLGRIRLTHRRFVLWPSHARHICLQIVPYRCGATNDDQCGGGTDRWNERDALPPRPGRRLMTEGVIVGVRGVQALRHPGLMCSEIA